MRKIPFIISIVITCLLVFLLNKNMKIGGQNVPAFGNFLSPQHGLWKNAESLKENYSADLNFPGLKGKVNVYLDERLVPHVFAEQENDAYFVQGYLHAKFRLWQMELQTRAAAGRISELMGDVMLDRDRSFRRLGMIFAAENTLKEIEKDETVRNVCNAYTAGVNAYIENLKERDFPIEYKLIGNKPEKWSNFKSVLFMKYMSYDLAGYDEDFEMTNAKSFFSREEFEILFPLSDTLIEPVIPKGTIFEKPKVIPIIPANADSVYFNQKINIETEENKPNRENGSNNWAVSGTKTKSGAPIFCNDLHLTLTLPSVWYEIQLTSQKLNVYGVSFPGVPGVMVGYNDSCAFGYTNGGRDVRDYYEIKFKDDSRNEYLFNGLWEKTVWRIDTIKINGKQDFIDSVSYVMLGNDLCPVMYDKTFSGGKNTNRKEYAVRWKGNDPSNDLKAFNLLDKSQNYSDFYEAMKYLKTPGQNCAFADKRGDIAILTQGEWPAKWKGQGDFIMPGFDTSYLWQGMIPQDEIPFQYNPVRGFVSSANQIPVDDSNYPYYVGKNFPVIRSIEINNRLNAMNNITPQEMMAMQTDNYNLVAEMTRPVILKNIKVSELSPIEKNYYELLKEWDLRNDTGSKGATVFEVLWVTLYKTVFDDEYTKAPKNTQPPSEITFLEGIVNDTAYRFIDNISTDEKETLSEAVTSAFKKASIQLKKAEDSNKLTWERYKGTFINHLTGLPALSRRNLKIGGSKHNINATEANHGPSWRMVVSLTEKTEAFGIYPGGQSGNPGSRYYDNFIDTWVNGQYYTLWMMTKDEINDKRIKWKINFSS
ncbi:MAG TPA: penicillin acylase family protein [Ignavibacteria bacterium]|nr:penicillin acylase family protein [Ignavibacteria bacterium]